MLSPRMRKLARNVQMMFLSKRVYGGGKVVGANVNGVISTGGGGTISVNRFVTAGNWVFAYGRSNGGVSLNITASGPGTLTMSQTGHSGISQGQCTVSGVYTFTSTDLGINVAATLGVLEITGITGTKTAFVNSNPGTLTPSPAVASVGMAFVSDSNFTAFPSMSSSNSIINFVQAGNAGNGFESLMILAQAIPGTPGTSFGVTFTGSTGSIDGHMMAVD